MILAGSGYDMGPWIHAFYAGLLRGVILVWPMWVALGLFVAGCLALGTFRRIFREPARSRHYRPRRRW